MRRGKDRNVQEKKSIVCAFVAKLLTRFGSLIYDGTAQEIWVEINRLYTKSNAQAIINLSQELESLQINYIVD